MHLRIQHYLLLGVAALIFPILVHSGVFPLSSQPLWLSQLLIWLPYALWLIVAVLGLKLNQTRIFLTSLLGILGFYFFHEAILPKFIAVGHGQRAVVTAVWWSFLITSAFSFGERRLFGSETAIRLGLGVLPLLLFALIKAAFPGVYRGLMNWSFLPPHEFWFLPGIVLISFIVACVVVLTRREPSTRIYRSALAAASAPILFGFSRVVQPGVSAERFMEDLSLAYSIAGATLLYGVFQLYWQRVYLDELTGVPNRRALDERLRALPKNFTIGMIDVDHFKKFNDSYGHEQGDDVLRYVALHFEKESKGKVYRYGGEEFALVFNGVDREEVFSAVDKWRKKLSEKQFAIRSSAVERKKSSWWRRGKPTRVIKRVTVTASIGLASPDGKVVTPDEVIRKADEALYQAKEAGRNCCRPRPT